MDGLPVGRPLPLVNNPRRVPPLLETIDQPQAGAPRTIHPITGLALEPGMERQDTDYYLVEQNVTKLSEDGRDSIDFAAGQRIHPAVARRFGFVADAPVASPDARAVFGAPENRMDPAPANRTELFTTGGTGGPTGTGVETTTANLPATDTATASPPPPKKGK